jgi:hypothetical protein
MASLFLSTNQTYTMKLKLYTSIIFLILVSLYSKAQVPSDAIRFSFTNYGGTARFQAIGGAMGSLGGEFSAALVNPAGLGLYHTNEWVVTPGFSFGKQKNNYRGFLNNKSQDGSLNIGSSGVLWSDPKAYRDDRSNLAFAVGFSQTASFRNTTSYSGLNNISSQSEVFLEDLSGYGANGGFNDINQYMNDVKTGYGYLRLGGTLAYNTGLVDSSIDRSVNPNQFNWLSKMKDSVYQDNLFKQRGGIYDVFGSVGGGKGKWFWGGTLTISILDYTRERNFKEDDATINKRSDISSFTYTNYSRTTGAGLSAKIGAIYKPKEFIRLGLAIHTATFYGLKDKYYSKMSTTSKAGVTKTANSYDYNGGAQESQEYFFNTPWKFIISGSYVFREIQDVTKQKGFITADIEYVPYGWMKYAAMDRNDMDLKDYLAGRNAIIRNMYKGNFNFRLGGELKFKVIMLRAGYAFYGNPYEDKALRTNLHRLSGGVGYRNHGFFVDLTYVHNISKTADVPYRISDNTPYATVKSNTGNVVATVGFKF